MPGLASPACRTARRRSGAGTAIGRIRRQPITRFSNPQESQDLKTGTPVTAWRFSREHLATAKIRGHINSVGHMTATFITVEGQLDLKWPED